MFDFLDAEISGVKERSSRDSSHSNTSILYIVSKRAFDVAFSLVLMPIMAVCALVLILLNPVLNAGPLFYVQSRMGRDCKPFKAIKFRTMREADQSARRADDPLELDRITPLGRILRKSRFDELPQILNVLKGDMSLIGPRPDYFDHAVEYLSLIPGYRERHAVRPGISGLAQIHLGYAEGVNATRQKVRADLIYIGRMSAALDAWIFWRTLVVVFRSGGA